MPILFFFFFNDTATTEIYTLSLHDALPISRSDTERRADLASVGALLRRLCQRGGPHRWSALAGEHGRVLESGLFRRPPGVPDPFGARGLCDSHEGGARTRSTHQAPRAIPARQRRLPDLRNSRRLRPAVARSALVRSGANVRDAWIRLGVRHRSTGLSAVSRRAVPPGLGAAGSRDGPHRESGHYADRQRGRPGSRDQMVAGA